MPKPIPDDKGGALTIHGNVGMVSGHKGSVKKVVKPQWKVNSLSSLKEKELRASRGLRSHKRYCQGLQSKGEVSDDHIKPKAACVEQRKRPLCPCCKGNHELHNRVGQIFLNPVKPTPNLRMTRRSILTL